MRFSEMAARLNGFSTPFFGVSWEPPVADRNVAREVVAFLEDRRVLYDPFEVEAPALCVDSVNQIRRFLTEVLGRGVTGEELTGHLQAIRAACREFLQTLNAPYPHQAASYQDYKQPLHPEASFLRERLQVARGMWGLVGAVIRERSIAPARLAFNHADDPFQQNLGKMRGIIGIHVTQISASYGIDIEGPLAWILPPAAD